MKFEGISLYYEKTKGDDPSCGDVCCGEKTICGMVDLAASLSRKAHNTQLSCLSVTLLMAIRVGG